MISGVLFKMALVGVLLTFFVLFKDDNEVEIVVLLAGITLIFLLMAAAVKYLVGY